MTWFDLGALLYLISDFMTTYSEFEFHVDMNNIKPGLLGSAKLRYYDGPVLMGGLVNDTLPRGANLTETQTQ